MGEPANRGRRSSSGGMMMHGVNLKRRFFVSLVLAVPILLLSSPMGLALPITLSFPGSDWLVAALATVLFVYGGWPFLRGAADEVRNRKPAMMTLVALGITTAYVYSMYAFAMGSVAHDGGMHMDFFWNWPRSSSSCCWAIGSRCEPSWAQGTRSRRWPNCCRRRRT